MKKYTDKGCVNNKKTDNMILENEIKLAKFFIIHDKKNKSKKDYFLLFFKASTAASFLPASILIQAPPPLLKWLI